ncbi:MAG: haloacid dehalogenase-like hydrolase, partial [Oscillospiraceae bacterium]|nr:haloacid dehalogenase-like hydrolase [Oscillospiraceae bacterium]
MNVYDFDQTVFQPDSSYCFVMYCLRHYPRAVLHCLPGLSFTGIQALRQRAETKELKEQAFSFLPRLDDVERIVEEFWNAHRQNLEPWYLAQKREDDLIVSASPDFLLRPICEELGVSLIATPMNPYTGKIHGLNCHD